MAMSMRPRAMIAPILIFCSCLACPAAFAAAASAALLKAKQEAESKGYVFFTSHEEIVSKAKVEGKLLILAGLEDSIEAITEAFKRSKSIDLHIEALKRPDDGQRVLLEVKAGAAKGWDITRAHADLYTNWLPHLWKVDLLGMAERGVLDIPPGMIDSKNRNVVALISRFAVVAYNRNLVSPARVPRSWEDMLKPEWKGRKFGADIRPQELAALVPAWGIEKTLDYARKIAAQQPIWGRSAARPLTALAAGEIPLYLFGANYGAVTAAQRKDPLSVIQFTVLEPVPVSVGSEQAILTTSKNPHAALLWLEFMAGAEGQKLIDRHEPLYPSRYSRGSPAERALIGKKLSVVSLENSEKLEQWIAKLTEAYGFPTAVMK